MENTLWRTGYKKLEIMKKILLTVVAAVVCVSGAFAQLSMGPKVGLNVSSVTGDGTKYRAGVNVGIFGNYRINRLFAIQPEFLYSMQGAAFDDVTILSQTLKSNYTSHYIDIPVLLKVYPWRGLNVQVGPQFGFCVDDEYKLKVNDEEISSKDLEQYGYDTKARTFDFAIALGLGYEFDFGMTIDARYNFGLTNIYEEGDGKNTMFMLSLGYKFDF